MQNLTFSVQINANKLRVWETLWSEQTYPQWTKAFCEGSYAVSDWQEGSRIHFLAPNGEGMYSVIQKKIDNKFMSFKHLGNIKDKQELALEENWEGNYENYTLTENENGTLLTASLGTFPEFTGFFGTAFPSALQYVKELAEKKTQISVSAVINVPLEKAWACWTEAAHIPNWSFASPDWHSPHATNDLREGGKFLTRMEAKDGSFGFDFEGVYLAVTEKESISYILGDNREVHISFVDKGESCEIIEVFDAENTHPAEMQQAGWQMIMNNFKQYTENI